MNSLERFNKTAREFVCEALVAPSQSHLILEKANKYCDDVLQDILKESTKDTTKITKIYEYRAVFSTLINLDLIVKYSQSFFFKRLLFFLALRKIKNPYNLDSFSKLIKPSDNSHWEAMFSKFTPSKDFTDRAKLEKIKVLNVKREELFPLNLSLADFEVLLFKLFKDRGTSIYLKVLLLMLSCGRRPVEIFNRNTTFVEVEGKLQVKGLAKKKKNNKINGVLITTFLAPHELIKIRESLLIDVPEFLEKSQHVNNLNTFFRKNIAPIFGDSIKKAYDCRSIFALYHYEKWGGDAEKNYYISKILGHEDTDLETAYYYNSFKIPTSSIFDLSNFSLKEELKKQHPLEGRHILRAELEEISDNPTSKNIFRDVSRLLLLIFKDEKIVYTRGFNIKMRKAYKDTFKAQIDPKGLTRVLEYFFREK